MTHSDKLLKKSSIAKNARSHGSQDDSIAIELMYIIYLEDRA